MENLLYTFVLDIKYKLIGLFITIVLNKKMRVVITLIHVFNYILVFISIQKVG